MRFDARELAVSLMPRNRAQGCQGGTESPGEPNCGACTPATTRTGPDDGEPADRCHRAGQLGQLRVQLGEALSQPGAR